MPTKIYQEIEFPSTCRQAKIAEDRVIEATRACKYTEEDIFAMRLSMEEALLNAIRHGNTKDQQKKITLRYCVNEQQIDIYVADEGSGFDPMKIADPTLPENLERPNGRGVMLMRAYMNLVEYNDIGNVVHMVKLNSQAPKPNG